MDSDLTCCHKSKARKRGAYRNAVFGLLAFVVTFALLRWVLF